MNEQVLFGVKAVLRDALDLSIDDVSIEIELSDFTNLDSLGYVKIIVGLSEQFGIEVDAEEILECESVGHICNYVLSIWNDKDAK